MATSIINQQDSTVSYSFNINTGSFKVIRIGNTVFCSCVAGTYDCPGPSSYLRASGATNALPQLPVGYRPAAIVEVKDVLIGKRLSMTASNSSDTGRFVGAEAFSSAALRFSATWVTTDPIPT